MKWTDYAGNTLTFFDIDKKETFKVLESEYNASKAEYELKNATMNERHKNPLVAPVLFVIKTITGEHLNWIYKTDEDYSEYMK